MSGVPSDFSKNLRHVCAERVSVAQVCREIGINPQQFNRYLSGVGMPSAHNLRRICLYFDLSEQDLLTDNTTFKALRGQLNKNAIPRRNDPLENAFPGDFARLKNFVGAYHIHFLSPSWHGNVMIGATFLDVYEGQVMTRTVERGHAADHEPLQRTRYDGKACYHGSRIYVVEIEGGQEGSLTQTILYPSHRQQRTYLRGLTMGISWRPRRMPYSARMIWKRADPTATAGEILGRCGVYPIDHRFIDPTIRNFLLEKSSFTGEE